MTIRNYIAAALRGVFACDDCGALVENTDTHNEWHDLLFPPPPFKLASQGPKDGIPMYQQGGLSGAWYPLTEDTAGIDERPDGWLIERRVEDDD